MNKKEVQSINQRKNTNMFSRKLKSTLKKALTSTSRNNPINKRRKSRRNFLHYLLTPTESHPKRVMVNSGEKIKNLSEFKKPNPSTLKLRIRVISTKFNRL